MAVFLLNICKFNGCGITFPSLGDLIQHIEDTHIDYDPKVVEQKEQAQPACLPLSYVLRFISDDARKESPFLTTNNAGAADLKRKLAIKHHSYSMSSSNRSNTPTGSEMDEDEMVVSESEDSNDSWTTEEFSSEFIMRYGSRHSGSGGNGTPGNEKPFACPVPGCKKRYKNVNGIKYHSKNGHKKDGKVRKGYKCHCGKSYKTAQGLKSHALVAHNSSPENVLVTQTALGNVLSASGGNAGSGVGVLMQRSSSPSQSLGSLSPSSISNMSSGASSCHGSGGGGGSGNGSQNILQHFSNTNHSNISAGQTVNCLAQAINGNGAATLNLQQQQSQQTQQQQQQQQFNTTANNHQQIVTAAAVGGSLGTTLLNNNSNTIAAAANSSTLANATAATESFSTSFSFSGQLLATAMQQHQRGATTAVASHGSGKGAGGGSGNGVGINGGGGGGGGCIVGVNNNANCFYAATAPPMQTATLLPFSSSASSGPLTTLQQPQPPAISPTFIEHKYSANTFKEKFLANLRQNQQNVHNKLKSLNSSSASLSSSSSSSTTTQIMDNPESDSGSITSETSNVVTKNSIETENINDDNGDNDGNNYNDEDNNDHDDFDNNGSCGVGGGNGNTEGVLASLFNLGEGNPEKCSIQQQLNETMKNNLYKKTIN